MTGHRVRAGMDVVFADLEPSMLAPHSVYEVVVHRTRFTRWLGWPAAEVLVATVKNLLPQDVVLGCFPPPRGARRRADGLTPHGARRLLFRTDYARAVEYQTRVLDAMDARAHQQ